MIFIHNRNLNSVHFITDFMGHLKKNLNAHKKNFKGFKNTLNMVIKIK